MNAFINLLLLLTNYKVMSSDIFWKYNYWYLLCAKKNGIARELHIACTRGSPSIVRVRDVSVYDMKKTTRPVYLIITVLPLPADHCCKRLNWWRELQQLEAEWHVIFSDASRFCQCMPDGHRRVRRRWGEWHDIGSPVARHVFWNNVLRGYCLCYRLLLLSV